MIFTVQPARAALLLSEGFRMSLLNRLCVAALLTMLLGCIEDSPIYVEPSDNEPDQSVGTMAGAGGEGVIGVDVRIGSPSS